MYPLFGWRDKCHILIKSKDLLYVVNNCRKESNLEGLSVSSLRQRGQPDIERGERAERLRSFLADLGHCRGRKVTHIWVSN